MANNDFERTIINVRERPLSSDINQAQSQLDRTYRDMLSDVFSTRGSLAAYPADGASVSSGCVRDSFRVLSTGAFGWQITPGHAFINNPGDVPSSIDGIVGLDDLSPYKPAYITSPVALTTPTPDPVHPRIDLVEVSYLRQIGNPNSRSILNPSTGVFSPASVNKTLTFNLDGSTVNYGTGAASSPIYYKQGVPAASPLIPAIDSNYIPVGAIYVPAAALSLSDVHAIDYRRMVAPDGYVRASVACEINHLTGAIITPQAVSAPPGFTPLIATFNSSGVLGFYVFLFGPNITLGSGLYGTPNSGLIPPLQATITPKNTSDILMIGSVFQYEMRALGNTVPGFVGSNFVGEFPGTTNSPQFAPVALGQFEVLFWNGSNWISATTSNLSNDFFVSFDFAIPLF